MKSYSVAIRTLGTAGIKFQRLLDSIASQTIQPKKVFVYLPYGCDIPKETIGIEKIIRCEKGMVMQRSLPFDEIDDDLILFCDDDISFPPNLVSNLINVLEKYNAACVVPTTSNERISIAHRVMSFIHTYSHPHFDKKWRIKICRSGVFSYSLKYKDIVMETQSANFRCFLCQKKAYKSIHYEDERWLDNFGYASCDDQLFFYKMYIHKYRVFYMKSDLKHLDAKAGGRHDVTKKLYLQKKIGFVIWYRTIWKIYSKSKFERLLCLNAYLRKCLVLFFMLIFEIAYYRKLNYFIDFFKAQIDGYKYVHSKEYLKIPSYDAYQS